MAEDLKTLRSELQGLQKKYMDIEEVNKTLNERLLELYSLYQISLALSVTLDLNDILKSIKTLFRKTFKVDQYSIMLLDDSTEIMHIESSFGLGKKVQNRKYHYGINIFGKSMAMEDLIYIPDMSQEAEYEFFPNGKTRQSGSFLTIPLIPTDGIPIGVLNLYRKEVRSFSNRDIRLLSKIAEQIAKVIDKTLLFKQTKEMSVTDELTGIYNRRYFNQRFEREVVRAKRYKRPLTLMMIDIDFFKNYNDLNGHILGDEVLKRVANLLEGNIRKADLLARFGGEEFVLLLPELDKEQAFVVAEKLRKAIQDAVFPEELNQPNRKLTISIGMATLLEDTYTSTELLDFADKALYKAKQMGRNRVIGYYAGLNGGNIYPLNSMAMVSNMN
ncbi:sensor domain-containing diguanylate cyclase [candidate division KSB1 bacterium]|nr:sensor domain-containing diguanylate cyclase [candidate division KSB1 bacterium]